MIPAIIGAIGSIFGGFFNFKGAQAETVSSAIDAVTSIDSNDAKSTASLAQALQVILSQGSWLEKNWRSWLMVGCTILLFAGFFGYTPPNFNDPLTPMMERIFSLLKIGLGGYITRRGIVDVVRMFNIGSILKTLINKKVM